MDKSQVREIYAHVFDGHNNRVRQHQKNKATSKRNISKRQELRHGLVAKAGASCHDCQFQGADKQFDFHHLVRADKKFKLSTKEMTLFPWETILEEFEKCVLVCANCHRLRH